MNVDELTGADLNEAVAKCLGVEITYDRENGWWETSDPRYAEPNDPHVWSPSTDWAQGGPIIERERMGVWNCEAVVDADGNVERDKCWYAEDKDGDHVQTGPTPLIAAMRCYVASKQGEMK
jgi:hypothetical protein